MDELACEGGPADEPSLLAQWTAAEDRRRTEADTRKQAVLSVRSERDAQHAAAQQAKVKARAARVTQPRPGVAASVQTRKVTLPAGFDPRAHAAGLRAKIEATGWTVKGVALQPADGSPAYAVIERAAAVA